jgi:hypothetical protein
MDLIYDQSFLTIIAAAGQDPDFGLPGVGPRTRRPQPFAVVGQKLLISWSENPTDMIRSSAWFQRGWTYQEALLSRRRLIFMEQEVYFECHGMYCFETLNIPLLDLHISSGQRLRSSLCHGCDLGISQSYLDLLRGS